MKNTIEQAVEKTKSFLSTNQGKAAVGVVAGVLAIITAVKLFKKQD